MLDAQRADYLMETEAGALVPLWVDVNGICYLAADGFEYLENKPLDLISKMEGVVSIIKKPRKALGWKRYGLVY